MFPFKYKLSLLISSIVALLLFAIYIYLKQEVGAKVTADIKNNLEYTQKLVAKQMAANKKSLGLICSTLIGNELALDVLRDKTIDKVTANDIVEEEIFNNYRVDLIAIINGEGDALGVNKRGKPYIKGIQSLPFYQTCLNGKKSAGYLIVDERCMQLVAKPKFIGPEVAGVIIAGQFLRQRDIAKIKELFKGQIDITFLNEDNQPFIQTEIELSHKGETLEPPLETILAKVKSGELSSEETGNVLVKGHQWLIKSFDADSFTPQYLVVSSLDKPFDNAMDPITKIIQQIFIAAVILTLFVSIIFAQGITRPVKTLQGATEEIDKANYEHRVDIKTRDEFRQLGDSFNHMIWGLGEKERIRGVMNKVVSEEIADELLNGKLELGGEEKEGTILFSDIRGFTTLSEGLKPKELVDLLNSYLTKGSSCIIERGGNIDKYLGDAIMALFGVPITHGNDAYDAIQAGLDMIEALDTFNIELEKDRGKTIDVGIGLNTGTLLAGLMGTQDRMEYTVIGDQVNLASRLEGLTKQYGVRLIISESTKLAIEKHDESSQLLIRELDCVQVKGKTEGIRIYQVFARKYWGKNLEPLIDRFEEARKKLESNQLPEALSAFEALSKDWQTDKTTPIYIDRVKTYFNDEALYDAEYENGVYICSEK